MDQLKPILVALNTHRFWVACGATAVICLVVWFLGTGRLSKESDDWASKITSANSTITNVRPDKILPDSTEEAYPNRDVEQGMNQLIDVGRNAVAEAWQVQYAKQNALFVWPEALPNEAREHLRSLRPIEAKVAFPTPLAEEVSLDWRMSYRDYIAARLPELANKIGAQWVVAPEEGSTINTGGGNDDPFNGGNIDGFGPGGNGGGFGPGGNDGGNDSEGSDSGDSSTASEVVVWNSANQELWHSKTTAFTGRNGNTSENNTPLTVQMLYAQEDLWVLEAIFDIIKATNGEADANDLAAIKEIDHIFVGLDATGSVGTIRIAQAPEGENQMGYGPGGGGSSSQGSSAFGSGGGATGGNSDGMGASAGDGGDGGGDPSNNRYVNLDYQPIGAGEIRGAFTNRNPQNAYLAVAKRIPVRIGLQMDERAIFELLAHCANSKPTIEVRQVRINKHTPGEIASNAAMGAGAATGGGGFAGGADGNNAGVGGPATSGGGSGGAMDGGGSGGGGGRSSSSGGGGGYGSSGLPGEEEERSEYTLSVEIYGIVHIFNPVDEERVKPISPNQPNQPVTMNSMGNGLPADNRRRNPNG